jgi:hypothetical protein
VLKGKSQQAIGSPESKLLADVHAVVLDGAVMDAEFCADLFAGLIFSDHMQNPAF